MIVPEGNFVYMKSLTEAVNRFLLFIETPLKETDVVQGF
jgi:hypothetical protein